MAQLEMAAIWRMASFVSANRVDAVSPSVDPRFSIRDVLLGVVGDHHDAAEMMASVVADTDRVFRIHALGRVSVRVLWTQALRRFLAAALADAAVPAEVLVNASGLPAVAVGLLLPLCQAAGVPVCAVDTQSDTLVWLHLPEGCGHWPDFNISDRFNLHGYFGLHGYEIESVVCSRESRQLPLEQAAEQMFALSQRQPGVLFALNWCCSQMRANDPLLTEHAFRGDAALLQPLMACGLFEWGESGRLRFASPSARGFVCGGWLEYFLFAELMALAESFTLQDAAMGVRVTTVEGVRSEFDLAVLFNNQLFLAECKARAPQKSAGGVGMDTLFKLDSLSNQGDLGSEAMLVTLSYPTEAEWQRADLQEIEIAAAGDLQNLRQRLKEWLLSASVH